MIRRFIRHNSTFRWKIKLIEIRVEIWTKSVNSCRSCKNAELCRLKRRIDWTYLNFVVWWEKYKNPIKQKPKLKFCWFLTKFCVAPYKISSIGEINIKMKRNPTLLGNSKREDFFVIQLAQFLPALVWMCDLLWFFGCPVCVFRMRERENWNETNLAQSGEFFFGQRECMLWNNAEWW